MAKTLASWLMEKEESTDMKLIEEKLAKGYKITMFPVWKLFDQQGNLIEKSTKPQKASGRRPWKRIWTKGMVDHEGKKWLI